MDHSARRSMKNAANCVKYGELQGSRNRNMSNAYGAFNITMLEARLSEGLLTSLIILGEDLSLDGTLSKTWKSPRLLGAMVLSWRLVCFCCSLPCRLRARSNIESLRGLWFLASAVSHRNSSASNEKQCINSGPQIRRGYPPNLSISFSGGKETKEDSLSNGERTGISPAPNLPSLGGKECGVWEHHYFCRVCVFQVRWNAALSRRG